MAVRSFDPANQQMPLTREAEGAEREHLWKLATRLYSGYHEYQERATNRRIPVVVLEPVRVRVAPS